MTVRRHAGWAEPAAVVFLGWALSTLQAQSGGGPLRGGGLPAEQPQSGAPAATQTDSVGGGYEFTRSTMDSGGVMGSTGGAYEISGTIGQADAGVMTGGDFGITGGFWFATPVGDCDDDGFVGGGDVRSVADCADGPGLPFTPLECVCSDFDGDGDIDLRDIAALQIRFVAQ